MKELLEQGIIGDLKLIRTSQNSFARRYDWQTLLYREGGAMRNNLAHSIEQIMDLASNDELPKIHSKLAIWNSVGDAGGLCPHLHRIRQRSAVRVGV